ncbi:MAG: helix-turn-helix transcriptional regulator, partial [Oscillospiraceae bacterium]|nr:helix-turn-helix transcriptional regulator [Oscillospiraceae bacterium]
MKVYEKVRAYIQEYGIKQIAVAKQAGIPNNTFNAILNGKRTLYADDLRAICLALEVSPEVFIEICSEGAEQPKKTERKMKMKPQQTDARNININFSIEKLKDRSADLESYAWIMERFNKTDVSVDTEFQRRFTRFYVLRRNAAQQKAYYDLLEACKGKENVSFPEILRALYEATGWVEASFSSKLLATIKPDMPIWDSIVLSRLGLKSSTSDDKEKRLASSEKLYESIVQWYHEYIPTAEAKEAISAFDAAFPKYIGFTATKKIDFLLWGSGTINETD